MLIDQLFNLNVNFHNEYLQKKFQIFRGDLFKINALFDRIKDFYDSPNKNIKEIPDYISEINFVLIFMVADLELEKENPNFKTEEESQELEKYLEVISQIQGIVKIKIFKQEKLILSLDEINKHINCLKKGIKKSERLSKEIEKKLKNNSDRVNQFVNLQNQLQVQLKQNQSIKQQIEKSQSILLQNQLQVNNKLQKQAQDLEQIQRIINANTKIINNIKYLVNFEHQGQKQMASLERKLLHLEKIKPLTEEEIREFFGRINLLHASVLSTKQALDDKIKIKRQILEDMTERVDLNLNLEPIDQALKEKTLTSLHKFQPSYLNLKIEK